MQQTMQQARLQSSPGCWQGAESVCNGRLNQAFRRWRSHATSHATSQTAEQHGPLAGGWKFVTVSKCKLSEEGKDMEEIRWRNLMKMSQGNVSMQCFNEEFQWRDSMKGFSDEMLKGFDGGIQRRESMKGFNEFMKGFNEGIHEGVQWRDSMKWFMD